MPWRAIRASVSAALHREGGLVPLLSEVSSALWAAGESSAIVLLDDGSPVAAARGGDRLPGAGGASLPDLPHTLAALPPAIAGRARAGQLEAPVPAELPPGAAACAAALGLPDSGSVAIGPLVSGGRAWGAVVVARDRPYTDDDLEALAGLAAELAAAARIACLEAELHTLHTLVEHIPCGVVLADLRGTIRIRNNAVNGIFRAQEPVRNPTRDAWDRIQAYRADGCPVKPDDWPLARTIRTGEAVHGEELRVTRLDGSIATLRVSTFPIRSPSGDMVGGASVFDDVTEQAAAKAALHDSEQQLRMVTDALPALVSLVGRDRRYRFANGAYRDLWGREVVVGETTVNDVLGPGTETSRPHLDAAFAGRRAHYQAWFVRPDGVARALDVDYMPRPGPDGAIDAVVVLARDVTEARRAEDRMAFLADASRVVASSEAIDDNLRALGPLAVPRLSDWFVLEVPDPSGAFLVLHTVHHADPALVAHLRQLAARWPVAVRDEPLMGDGGGELHDGEAPLRAATGPEHAEALSRLRIRSRLRVPVPTSRGRFGVLTLAMAESRRGLSQADLAVATELAARIGLSIDNARLVTELKEADRNKEEFLAMLAHELRNPMAPILTGLQLLAERSTSAEATARTLATIERQTVKLARLVDDLLDVSRINRGRIDLAPIRCELAAVVRDAVATAGPLIASRRHRLSVHVPQGLRVLADPVRLEQVFANLIDNAAKYSPPASRIAIEAAVDPTGDPPHVEVAVTDEGAGIAPELLPYVFRLFHQGQVGLDRSSGGLGLGLALVERLVHLHGGTVRAESGGPGRGSRFVVRLPLPPGDAAEAPDTDAAGAASGPARSVLVVDDNVDAATALAELLTTLGHRATAVHDAQECFERVSRDAPDVILLDIGLPGTDGFAVARRLRSEGYRGRIVAVTGYGRAQDRTASREAGCDDHLVKPVGARALLAAVTAPRKD